MKLGRRDIYENGKKNKGMGTWDRVLLKLITHCRLHDVNFIKS